MIERNILAQKIKEFKIREFIAQQFMKTGYSHTKIQRTPLGDKVIIYTTRPGLVVGRKGENIKKLTNVLKNRFKLENPQIEIGEVTNPALDAQSVAEKIAYSLEKFGSSSFKSIGYKTLQSIMDGGALGAEIVLSGKIPSARAKRWRFIDGYLKKCGYVSDTQIIRGEASAQLKPGTVGIFVSIMPPNVVLPDRVNLIEQSPQIVEETKVGDETAEKKVIMAVKEKKSDAEKAAKKEGKKNETKRPKTNKPS